MHPNREKVLFTRVELEDKNTSNRGQIMIRLLLLSILVAVAPLALQSVAMAEEDNSQPMVEEWVVSAKVGSETEFMDALKTHVEWRRENKDPWSWNLYTPQTGKMNTRVLIRSTAHEYLSIASYGESEFNQKAARHWNETVASYAGVSTRRLRFQTPVSYWPDETYDYLLILQVDAKPDASATLLEAAKELHDIARESELEGAGVGGLEYTWAGGGPAYQYVEGHKDWASTSPGSPLAFELSKLVIEKLGEDKADETYEAAQIWHNPSMQIYRRLDW